jgi:heptosyltransferase III
MNPIETPNGRPRGDPLVLPPRPRVLVVALRRLGDVLFATPLIASIRRAFPQARIDALVFADTAGMLASNRDLDHVVTMPAARGTMTSLALALRLFKRYDLAVSTQSGDRPTFFALLAGRRHVGPIDGGRRGRLRRMALSRAVPNVPGLHRLEEMLRLADALGIERVAHLACPGGAAPRRFAAGPYAVIHAAPQFTYKRWTRDGWRALAAGLRDRGLAILATGGPAPAERAFLDDIWGDDGAVTRLDGALSWPELTALLAKARLYVGPDTSITHLAAASGCPTVALYGPTDPRRWGPVPATGLDPMWEAAGTIQHRGNVWLVQNPLPCLPCQNEGCERHLTSFSRCLDALAPAQVLRAVDAALDMALDIAPDTTPDALSDAALDASVPALPHRAAEADREVARPPKGRYG